MAHGLKIADHLGVDELRVWARRCGNGRTAARAYAIANALDGLDRATAARLALAALRGLVRRYDAFRVTAKGGARKAGRFCAVPEAVLAAALLAASAPAALCNPMGTMSLALWSALIAAMAAPNLMAITLALADTLPPRPAPRPAADGKPRLAMV